MIKRLKRPMAMGSLIIMLFLALTASMCDDNDDNTNTSDVSNSLKAGTWTITYYFDQVDETSDFAGYEFTFNDDGTAVAILGATSTNGTWSVENSSSGERKLNLDFGTSSPLDELEEDWKILESNSNRIKLENVSGGSGLTSSLTFERK